MWTLRLLFSPSGRLNRQAFMLAVIGVYALLMLFVGLYVMRFNRSAAEYFRGGSRIPWLVAGLSCFMAGFSAWTFTGAAGTLTNVVAALVDGDPAPDAFDAVSMTTTVCPASAEASV